MQDCMHDVRYYGSMSDAIELQVARDQTDSKIIRELQAYEKVRLV